MPGRTRPRVKTPEWADDVPVNVNGPVPVPERTGADAGSGSFTGTVERGEEPRIRDEK